MTTGYQIKDQNAMHFLTFQVVDWIDIQRIAAASYDPNIYLQTEFLQLVEKAENIYSPKKRKKNKICTKD